MGHELRDRLIEKVHQLRAIGIDPYPPRLTEERYSIYQVCEKFDPFRPAEEAYVEAAQNHRKARRAGEVVEDEPSPPARFSACVAGRVRQMRRQGKKLVFIDLEDQTGSIQLLLNATLVTEASWQLLEYVDLGDWISAKGPIGLSQTSELSVFVESIAFVSKAIEPPINIAEKVGGEAITDPETRQRRRYLDLMTNRETQKRFFTRSRIISSIRNYLDTYSFIEVETPMLQPLFGGAAAKPFITHHNALNREFYLRIAPELYLKRLLVGGLERVYEINRNFRNEGVSTRHNPEFTMLEVYGAFLDYRDMMELAKGIIHAAIDAAELDSAKVVYQGIELDFSDIPAHDYVGLLNQYAEVDWDDETAIRQKATSLGIDSSEPNIELLATKVWDETVEPNLVQPCFVVNYPLVISPLAKKLSGTRFTERFEMFAAGMELGNAFSELNDPIDQRNRFEEQVKTAVEKQDDEIPRQIDDEFLLAMCYGMPMAGGLGIGIDRLVMLLTDSPSIRDVILFPQLRNI